MNRLHGFLPIALSCLIPASALSAQTVAHNRTLPKILTGSFGTLDVAAPGAKAWRAQTWYGGVNLPKTQVIKEIGFRQSPRFASPGFSGKLTITLDNSSVAFDKFTNDFGKNLSKKAVVVYSATTSAKAVAKSKHTNTATIWVKLPKPFVYSGPNLIVDIQVSNQKGTLVIDGLNQARKPNLFLDGSKSCGGTLTGKGTAGGLGYIFDLDLNGAKASTPAALMVSAENHSIVGAGLPIDLTPLGMRGCVLGISPDVFVPMAVDATGKGSVALQTKVFQPMTVSFQALHMQGTGLATTGGLNLIGGDKQVCNATTDVGGKRFGPKAYNVGLVTLIR